MARFEVIACLWIFLGLAAAEVVPFIEPGFFFSYGKTPVTEQCETVRLIWGRQGAIGQNPVAPYSFQVLTSTFIFPFNIDAGNGGDAGDGNLFFDFTVPFAPGTQYQICMYDSNGLPGGCQVIFTMIKNSTIANPTCKNLTMPAQNQLLSIQGLVDGGPLSQDGFINQCDDVSVKPLNGTPPFTLTVSPPNHPPYNITSNTMDPIVWTVSLSRAMPFWLSLVSSEGLTWANGPMGVGRSDVDTCLAPDTILKSKAHAVAAGAGVGGLFGGFFLVGSAFLLGRLRSNRQNSRGIGEILPWRNQMDGSSTKSNYGDSSMMQYGYGAGSVEIARGGSNVSRATVMTGARVFVRHQDGGRVASPMPEEQAEIVELPPRYVNDERVPRVLLEKPLPQLTVANVSGSSSSVSS